MLSSKAGLIQGAEAIHASADALDLVFIAVWAPSCVPALCPIGALGPGAAPAGTPAAIVRARLATLALRPWMPAPKAPAGRATGTALRELGAGQGGGFPSVAMKLAGIPGGGAPAQADHAAGGTPRGLDSAVTFLGPPRV